MASNINVERLAGLLLTPVERLALADRPWGFEYQAVAKRLQRMHKDEVLRTARELLSTSFQLRALECYLDVTSELQNAAEGNPRKFCLNLEPTGRSYIEPQTYTAEEYATLMRGRGLISMLSHLMDGG